MVEDLKGNYIYSAYKMNHKMWNMLIHLPVHSDLIRESKDFTYWMKNAFNFGPPNINLCTSKFWYKQKNEQKQMQFCILEPLTKDS